MLAIDIVWANRISEEMETSKRKLMRMDERIAELFRWERQFGIAEEVQELAGLSEALKQIAAMYAAAEERNMDYLEERNSVISSSPFCEWSVPDWIFPLLG